MNCEKVKTIVLSQFRNSVQTRSTDTACRIDLPLLEPNGDSVGIYVESVNDELMVHDGGHIFGLLFEAGPTGASASDHRAVAKLIEDTGLKAHQDRGIVFVITGAESLSYWVWEIARLVVTVAATIPTSIPKRRGRRHLGPKVAKKVIESLLSRGLMEAIQQNLEVKGITEQEHRVNLGYTLPKSPLRPETNVYILTLDLDTGNPIKRSQGGLAIASDLSSVMSEYALVEVRLIHAAEEPSESVEKARKFLRAISERDFLKAYSWNDLSEREAFLETVGKELGPVLSHN